MNVTESPFYWKIRRELHRGICDSKVSPQGKKAEAYLREYREMLLEFIELFTQHDVDRYEREKANGDLVPKQESVTSLWADEILFYHQAGVKLCEHVKKYRLSPPVGKLAEAMLARQLRTIGELEAFAEGSRYGYNSGKYEETFLKGQDHTMGLVFWRMGRMDITEGGHSVEALFLRGMLAQHSAAMAAIQLPIRDLLEPAGSASGFHNPPSFGHPPLKPGWASQEVRTKAMDLKSVMDSEMDEMSGLLEKIEK